MHKSWKNTHIYPNLDSMTIHILLHLSIHHPSIKKKFFLVILGFELRAMCSLDSSFLPNYFSDRISCYLPRACLKLPTACTTSATLPALFWVGFFETGSHGTICQGWLRTTILLISISWVGRIKGVSHQRLAHLIFWCIPK
jgi:hypothetical protein